jgi:hypothetical protein
VHYSGTRPDVKKRGVPMVALMLLLGSAHLLRAAEVYKSVDAEGHVVYSDRAGAPAAAKSVVHVDQPNPAEVARMAKEQEILKADDVQRNRQKSVDDKKKAQQDHDKQVQCDNARNRYYTLREARRIFQRDADGNRVFYTDLDAGAKREEARQAMMTACGT